MIIDKCEKSSTKQTKNCLEPTGQETSSGEAFDFQKLKEKPTRKFSKWEKKIISTDSKSQCVTTYQAGRAGGRPGLAC